MDFWKLETLKIVLPSRRELNFYKIAFFENQAKINRKNLPKSFPKPSPTLQKSKINRQKSPQKCKMAEDASKIRKMSPKSEKSAQKNQNSIETWAAMERKAQQKQAKVSQSKQKQSEASKSKQKQAIEPARI